MFRILRSVVAMGVASAIVGCSAAPTAAESASSAAEAAQPESSPSDPMIMVAVVKPKADAFGSSAHVDAFESAAFRFRAGAPDYLYQRVAGPLDLPKVMGTRMNEFVYCRATTRATVADDEARFRAATAEDTADVKFATFREFDAPASGGAADGGFPVVTFAQVRPGTEAHVAGIVARLAEGSRQEPGNITYHVAEGEGASSTSFLFYERWPVDPSAGRFRTAIVNHEKTRSAFQKHLLTPLFVTAFAQIAPSLTAPPEIMELREIRESK